MGKAIFIGENVESIVFRTLGIEWGKPDEEKPMEEYTLIFTEEQLYKGLKKQYPHKIIIPLINFKEKRGGINRRIEKIIKDTVGEAVLKNE